MDPSSTFQLVVLIVLVMLSAFFSSAETALTTVSQHKLRALVEQGNKRAAKVIRITENSGKLLSAVLIGNNIVNISASSLATVLFTNLYGSTAVGITTGVLTLVILIFGEITPKTVAKVHNVKLALLYADVIAGLMWILTPVIWLLDLICAGIFKILHIDPQAGDTITEGELRAIVNVSHEEGVIEGEEKEMITNVVDFGDSLAKDVMVPRVDMVFISVDATVEEILNTYMDEQYTRLPVYEESKDNVIGILHVKDFFFYYATHKDGEFNIREIIREPLFTYELQKTSDLMNEMRKGPMSMAIVLDEYGVTAGLVTLEDLVEEIVGDIRDEYDDEEREAVRQIEENLYEVDGSMNLEDLNDILGLEIHSEDYDSVGGHMIELLEHLPEEGDTATEGNVTYTVEQMQMNRIEKVLVKILPETQMQSDSIEPQEEPAGDGRTDAE